MPETLSSGGGAGEEPHPRRGDRHPDLWGFAQYFLSQSLMLISKLGYGLVGALDIFFVYSLWATPTPDSLFPNISFSLKFLTGALLPDSP
jgi:hypothetical protein